MFLGPCPTNLAKLWEDSRGWTSKELKRTLVPKSLSARGLVPQSILANNPLKPEVLGIMRRKGTSDVPQQDCILVELAIIEAMVEIAPRLARRVCDWGRDKEHAAPTPEAWATWFNGTYRTLKWKAKFVPGACYQMPIYGTDMSEAAAKKEFGAVVLTRLGRSMKLPENFDGDLQSRERVCNGPVAKGQFDTAFAAISLVTQTSCLYLCDMEVEEQ